MVVLTQVQWRLAIKSVFMSLAALLLTVFSTIAASQTPLLGYTLRDLNLAKNSVDLKQFEGTPVMFVFFEPDCPWCFKQVKTTNQVWPDCPESFQPIAVGVHGNRSQLKKEAHRLRAQFPTLQASPELINDIGEIPGTPLIIFSDNSGNYTAHYRGFHNRERLVQLLSDQGIACTEE
ncbi:thioredoxin family protein [Sessilibacter corallicola]|uniref:Thioredoxin domain-containing protein n=1 Tax=Sessilibacter corallicola TaxID=2904075 RepID=A0ABQ0A3Z3_9GAMM